MVERVDWSEFESQFEWNQGEHVTAIGPTGAGKTVLIKEILKRRERAEGAVCVMASKPVDPRLSELQRRGYLRIRDWTPHGTGPEAYVRTWREVFWRLWDKLAGKPTPRDPEVDRILLWPRFRGPRDYAQQIDTFERAFSDMFADGRWCVYLDELRWFNDTLGMTEWPKIYWLQGRSLKLSFVVSTQRPRWVPLEAFSMATHLFLWKTSDEQDLARIGGLGALNSTEIRQVVASLAKFDVLYVNTRDDTMLVTRAPFE